MKYKVYNARTRKRIHDKDILEVFQHKKKDFARVKGIRNPVRVFLEKKYNNGKKAKKAMKILKVLYPSIKGLCISYGDNEMDIINS